jgi:hypothetical protein
MRQGSRFQPEILTVVRILPTLMMYQRDPHSQDGAEGRFFLRSGSESREAEEESDSAVSTGHQAMKNENGVYEVGGDLTMGCNKFKCSKCAILGGDAEVGMASVSAHTFALGSSPIVGVIIIEASKRRMSDQYLLFNSDCIT